MRRTRPLAFVAALLMGGACFAQPAGPAATAPALTFADAAARLAVQAPELRAADSSLEGARRFADRAGRLPEPTVAFSAENFGGGGAFRGFDGAEVTASVAQPLEFGARRSARVGAARAGVAVAEAERAAARRNAVADLVTRFAEAAGARERLALATERLAIARELAWQAARRLSAGDLPEVQARRIEADAAAATASAAGARIDLQAAEEALGALVGLPSAAPDPAWLRAASAAPPPSLPDAAALPDEEARRARSSLADADARLARAATRPHAELSVGVRRLRDADATVGVGGVTLGVPLWGSASGAAMRADAEARRVRFAADVARRDAGVEARRALAGWASGAARLAALEGSAVPAAERALQLSRRGFAAGALPYRDLADAVRSLLDAREAVIEARHAVAAARATLVRLGAVVEDATR